MPQKNSLISRLRARQTSGARCEACKNKAAANSRFCALHLLGADIKASDAGRDYVRVVEDQRSASQKKK